MAVSGSSLSTDHSSLLHIELCIHNEEKHSHFSVRMKLAKFLSLRCCVPLLWSCLSSSSSLALCVKKRVAEAMTWAQDQLCSLRGRTALRLGVLVVFINQMLLMMAGDVEPNPGPGEGEEGKRRDQGKKEGCLEGREEGRYEGYMKL